ncbi:hypothetical protein VTO73DRAFT_211 [Trametes versicolor]
MRQAGLRSRDEADTGHGSGTLELYPRPRSPDVFESAAVGERVLSDLSAVRRWVPLSSESDGRHGCSACVQIPPAHAIIYMIQRPAEISDSSTVARHLHPSAHVIFLRRLHQVRLERMDVRECLRKHYSPVTGRRAGTSTPVDGQAAQDALEFVNDRDNETVSVECLEAVDHDEVGEEREDVLDLRSARVLARTASPPTTILSTRPSEDGT